MARQITISDLRRVLPAPAAPHSAPQSEVTERVRASMSVSPNNGNPIAKKFKAKKIPHLHESILRRRIEVSPLKTLLAKFNSASPHFNSCALAASELDGESDFSEGEI